MNIIKYVIFLFFLILFIKVVQTTDNQPPRVTVIFVVDQFAYHYIPKLQLYFKHGLKKMLDDGVVYKQAHCPHGMPSTATGHAGLNTGTYAKDHGAIGNSLFSLSGEKIPIDFDNSKDAVVFGPQGTYDFGRSAKNLMVDGLSDQFVLSSKDNHKARSFSICLKSRAAILTSGKLGKAIWFDEKSGQFTSSKAFFTEIPVWLKIFNNQFNKKKPLTLYWPPLYDLTDPAYSMAETSNELAAKKFIGTRYIVKASDDMNYTKFMQMPHAHQLLFDLAKIIVTDYASVESNERLLLWVCLSSLDKLGHELGPDSLATIDMIYYLDKQLGNFLEFLNQRYGSTVLTVLTSDHGISPLIETMQAKGYRSAQRYSSKEFVEYCNEIIAKQFGCSPLVLAHKTPSLFLNQNLLDQLEKKTQKDILSVLLTALHKHPAIKSAWLSEELKKLPFEGNQIENFFKQQLYENRSGQITLQTFPYTIITNYPTGISHKTPYDYDTHVPLILHREGVIEKMQITQKVWTLQLANSLADILQINRPSASIFEPLPGIFYSTGCSLSIPKSLIKEFSEGDLPKNSLSNKAGSLLPPGAKTKLR